MVSLIDIGEARKSLTLRGKPVEFKAVPLKFLTDLLAQSNELRVLLAEKRVDGDLVTNLIADLPDLVAQCIACSVGKAGDLQTIGFILIELSPGEWVECLEVVIELSFPKGLRSFVDALFRAGRSVGLDVPGWEAGTKSPAPSLASSQEDTLPRPLGDTAPDKSEPGTNSTDASATATTST